MSEMTTEQAEELLKDFKKDVIVRYFARVAPELCEKARLLITEMELQAHEFFESTQNVNLKLNGTAANLGIEDKQQRFSEIASKMNGLFADLYQEADRQMDLFDIADAVGDVDEAFTQFSEKYDADVTFSLRPDPSEEPAEPDHTTNAPPAV